MKIPELQHIPIAQHYTPRQTALLKKIGVFTIEDLLTYFPFRYEDRSRISLLADLIITQEPGVIKAEVVSHQNFFWNKKRQTKIVVKDSSAAAELVAFNMRGIVQSMPIGAEFYIYGKFEFRFNTIQASSFEFESPEKFTAPTSVLGRLLPIYRLTEGLRLKEFFKILQKTFDLYQQDIQDPIPDYFRENRKLLSKQECLLFLHFPQQIAQIEKARIRGAYEEFLGTRITLELKRLSETKVSKKQRYPDKQILEQFYKILPFELTSAQYRVIQEINADLNQEYAMHRLVQGDVGSGKTSVALAAMLLAASNGHQVALLSPTEVLAFQHYKKIKPIADQLNIPCALLTGSFSVKERRPILEGLKEGTIPIIIGTHALFQTEILYHNLSLVIIDEQHKFGVEQRGQLIAKGENPDILVMTATPIPRTITLSLYGDLDISIIDELPLGRQKIITKQITARNYQSMIHALNTEIQKGRQVFIVCPFIEDNEKIASVKSVEQVYQEFQSLFPQYHISMIHGKMSQDTKDQIMQDFSLNKSPILIATTVIEVGIDIPNATVMIIENAERFGLAQLHQLRGRIGRGSHESYCFAVNYSSDTRLEIFCSTEDGFKIAEEDLKIRGPGEILGTRQTGMPIFKLADFIKDQKILQAAVNDAHLIITKDPQLQLPIHHSLLRFLEFDHSFRIFSG
ncbi:MAG: ATP-dependent DNA helicase RecG [Brevinema sp.]